jgi:carboxyl-terminal processing protease
MSLTATSTFLVSLSMTLAHSTLSVPAAPAASPTIFENVAAILGERYYDKKFREEQLPGLIEKYRPVPDAPCALNAQRAAAEKLLAHVPASHLGLLSEESFHYLVSELRGEPQPTFGFQLLRRGDEFFAFFVLEDGPAALAGVRPWERVVSIDGVAVAESSRLDWAQKDAHLPVDRDPPLHSVLCRKDDEVALVLEQRRGEQRTVLVRARLYSALQAARASAGLIQIGGRAVGYVHFWFIHSSGVTELLRDLFAGEFSSAEGLILDLRGRGGNGVVVPDILRVLEDWQRPIVALVDRQSRSAKDALAYEFKQRRLAILVGEKTAGAVIPASFTQVGEKTMLMFPSFTLGEYTQKLELKGGVAPDVFVERPGAFSAGDDPIFDRGKQEMDRLMKSAPRASQTVAPAQAAQRVSPAPAPKALPSVPELIRKMTDALGGEKQIRAHSHRTLTGTAEMIGLPMKGDYLQKASAPNRSLVVMHLGDLVVRQGFDGEVAWSDTPMTGKQIVTGAAADLIRQQAQFYGPLDLLGAHREARVVGFSVFDTKQCAELKLVGHGGMESFLCVDAETYFVAGTRMSMQTPIGLVETKTYFRNQRDLAGFVTATEIYIDSSLQRQLIKIEKVTFDEIAASEYSPPAGAM